MRTAIVVFAASVLMAPALAQEQVSGRLPVFFALSVPNVEASVRWYRQNLGCSILKRTTVPNYEIVLMRTNGVVVELVQSKRAIDPKSLSSGSQAEPEFLGISKVGFSVDDIAVLAARFNRSAIKIEAGPFYDDALQGHSLIIRDNNGNLLQFFDTKPNR